jgi:outer membrane lipoprotein SlyB
MKKQIQFVSVEESALESVAGGLADILNGSLNGNTINVLSGDHIALSVGDVASGILNIANQVSSACCPPKCWF